MSTNVVDFATVLDGLSSGREPLEDPSALGGVFVDDETRDLVADLETVAFFGFDGDMKGTIGVIIQVVRNAAADGKDPIEAARDWLDGWLDLLEKTGTNE